MSDNELPFPPSPGQTSMLISGNASLPGLQNQLSSDDGSIENPRTPGPADDMPMALPRPSPDYSASYSEDDDDDDDDYDDDDDDDDDEQVQSRMHPEILECPMDFMGCRKRFVTMDHHKWRQHSLEHFVNDVWPPHINRCVFCARQFHSSAFRCGTDSWYKKLDCAYEHHTQQGLRLADARHPDVALHLYLWESGILTPSQWKDLMKVPGLMSRWGNTRPASPPHAQDPRLADQRNMVMEVTRLRNRSQEKRKKVREIVLQFGLEDNDDSSDLDSDRESSTSGRSSSRVGGSTNSEGPSAHPTSRQLRRRSSIVFTGRASMRQDVRGRDRRNTATEYRS